MRYVNIVIDNNTRYTDAYYTYRSDIDIKPGDVVKVPFNRGNSEKRGYVFDFAEKPDIEESKIKSVLSLNADISLTEEIVSTCMWMKKRYGIKY